MPDNSLNIFLSYKMPKADEDKADIAELFAKELSDYSAGRIDAHYAGAFERGVDWRNEIIKTIKKCDIFILLYTGGDQQWNSACLRPASFVPCIRNGSLL